MIFLVMVMLPVKLPDNQWTYMKTHGDPNWEALPSYLDVAVPRILEFLKERNIQITFFVVGQDAVLEKNHDARAEDAIESVTGVRVKGFRGPGFSLSTSTLNVLQTRGYEYDATSFPNVLNPLARAYFFYKSQLSDEEKQQRKALFGTFSDAKRPVKPYRWALDQGELLELPVTTMPLFKVPVHFSYLVYLASYSSVAANLYTSMAASMCRMTGTEPSLLLHPLDFMGVEDNTGLEFFPAMTMPVEKKLELMDGFFSRLQKSFRPVPMGEHISLIRENQGLKQYPPRFAHDKAAAA